MNNIERILNFLYFLAMNRVSESLTKLSLAVERASLAGYISGHSRKRFTPSKMDSSIYIVVYRTQDAVAHVASVFVQDGDVERMKHSIVLKERAAILFCEDFSTFRSSAIRSAGTKKALPL